MTESDYRWLANDNLPGQTIRVVAGSEWHYAQGGWHETDPVLELTAADIEAEQAAGGVLDVDPNDDRPPAVSHYPPGTQRPEEPVAELAEDEQEPDPQPPAQEES